MLIFVGLISLSLLILGIHTLVIKAGCTEEMDGVFVRHDEIRIKNGVRYAPVFRYQIGAEIYERTSLEALSKKSAGKYKAGQTCRIYVNRKNHSYFVLQRTYRPVDFLLVAIGALMLILVIISLMNR
ncbi:MAG: DUF3592 domain-containing protein [Clostridia bacterium]|nr:DUF3592 domain-containing protein [Clostridia bacterium]